MRVRTFKEEAERLNVSEEAVVRVAELIGSNKLQGIGDRDNKEFILYKPEELEDLVKLLTSQSISIMDLGQRLGIGNSQVVLVVNKLLNENTIKGTITTDDRFIPEKERIDALRRRGKDEIVGKLTLRLAEGTLSEESYRTAIRSLEETEVSTKEGEMIGEHVVEHPSRASNAWYLVPFFFGIIGGLIAWIATKDEDHDKAENLLSFGFMWGVLQVFTIFVIYSRVFSAL
ncbi:MAG: hypothetical protein V1850_04500 [Candidatus Bathyarchaeota archaeon]